ncbi:hypothetical protein [Desulforhopalus sp. IMCC35007]|uniref:hypothetical protein n=1 Tax=Desulforhopalus sp. IMCC35007 TaxID=2569543 RepID=UPI0010AE0BC6|nr:hypothetical protein [Desulforhopalus sp. IMCC35007]TKB11725.1 hypothetical protein FCL48_02720 [Desulforhopalus sp. IMCC35007]
MGNYFFITAAMYLSWLVSPESLVIVSRAAGTGGWLAPPALAAAATLCYCTAALVQRLPVTRPAIRIILILQAGTDLAAKTALVIFIPTGVLVTAGFTFNETFLYWFPNFAFSAILLAALLILHLAGNTAVERSQQIFTLLTVTCLSIIILSGLFTGGGHLDKTVQMDHPLPQSQHLISLFFGGLLFFLGGLQPQKRQLTSLQLFFIFCGATSLLILWQTVAMSYIPHAKLASSTIPYILVGREILGQEGRIIIGIATISGTCAVVNYFLHLATSTHTQLMGEFSSLFVTKPQMTRRAMAAIFSAAIAVCMATGLAGEQHLEHYIYGALLLWLLNTGIETVLRVRGNHSTFSITTIFCYMTSCIFFMAFIYFVITYNDSTSLLIFITLALGLGSLLAAVMSVLSKKFNRKTS